MSRSRQGPFSPKNFRDRFLRSCEAHGQKVGHKKWGPVWVLDGKAYLVRVFSVTKLGDWSLFQAAVRNGKHPDYVPLQEVPECLRSPPSS